MGESLSEIGLFGFFSFCECSLPAGEGGVVYVYVGNV